MRIRALALLGLTAIAVGALSRPAPGEGTTLFETEDRGRLAERPHQMTFAGWRDIVVRAVRGAFDDRLFAVSAGVAFYALLAVVPALSVAVSLYGLFGDPGRLADFPSTLAALLPGEALTMVQDQARRLAEVPSQALSLRLLIGLALSMWGASAAVRATFDALNVIYDEEEKRSTFVLYATALFATIMGLIVVLFAAAIIGANPTFLAFGSLSSDALRLFTVFRWPLFFTVAVISLAGLYWLGPSRRPARFVWLLPGACFSAFAWAAVSAGFSWYVATLGNYSATYGSLATVVVTMTWLWLSTAAVLFGAQLNAELEHQTAYDTTVGPPLPIGVRGAAMADRIGAQP